MHLKREVFFVSTVLILLSAIGLAVLASSASVNLNPTQTSGKVTEFSFTITNSGPDNINKVEIAVPLKDNAPAYQIREIGSPVGWTYETRFAVGASSPSRVIWSTSSSGLAIGNSMTFNFVAAAPSSDGTFAFEWKAVDLKGVETSSSVQVNNFVPVVSSFKLGVPTSVKAGSEFNLIVTAQDQQGNKKSDFTGTVGFSSSDENAVLPSEYKFTTEDAGTKSFKVKFKTAGTQEIKVTDGTTTGTASITVAQGDVKSIDLILANSEIAPRTTVQLTVFAFDLFDNKKDVTSSAKFEIDREAKGTFSVNGYKSEIPGKWTIVARHSANGLTFSDGETIVVAGTAPAPEPTGKGLELTSEDLVNVPVNSTKTFVITVKNTGATDLKNVNVVFTGFPINQMTITPAYADIAKGESKTYTAEVLIPDKVDPLTVTFLATSQDVPSTEVNTTKAVTFNVTEAQTIQQLPTGKFTINKNLTYLGVAIVVAVILILLFWSLFLREDGKKKKTEKEEE